MRKKILIIVENLSVPLDKRVWSEASSLYANGYDVTILSPQSKQYPQEHEIIDHIHIYRHPVSNHRGGSKAYLIEYLWALVCEFWYTWRIFFERGFDVIQGCNPPDDIFVIALPFRFMGIPYIFDHHDVTPELYVSKYDRKGLTYKLQCWLEKLTFQASDVVMSTNNSYRNVAITRGGVDPADVFVVRNGPDLERVRPVLPNRSLKYGKCYLVGYVGCMDVQEGLDILLDVALHIKTLGRDDIHFTCVGDGPQLSTLRKITRDKGLEDVVNFTGTVSDRELMEILSTSDVCVNPDKPCPMNDMSTMIKIMEYMALGKPIVQFDVKEGRFSAGEASLYADKENCVADFAAKILWILDRPEEGRRMGQFGRRRVEQELAWQYSVKQLLAAYERAFMKTNSKLRTDGSGSERPKSDKEPERALTAGSGRR